MTIKPDLIITWPRNNDYPLWRHYIRQNRDLFNKVIVSFMETNSGYDYRQFVYTAMAVDRITFLPAIIPASGQDWRDVSVNDSLKNSESEWVYFTEQDFFPKDGFWESVEMAFFQGAEVIGVSDAGRLHPCSLLIKRSVLDKTGKYFGIGPGRYDHFGKIQQDLAEIQPKTAIITDDLYKHYNGLSHNFSLLSGGQQPNYKPEDFGDYIKQCLACGIELEQIWVKTAGLLTL